MRILDFADGFESSSPPTATPTTVTGTSSAPETITAAGGISVSGVSHETIYVQGTGGVTVTANPRVQAGTVEGQVLVLVGTSDTHWVELDDGQGLEMNGPCRLTNKAELVLVWNATAAVWRQRSQNGMV